MFIGGLWLTRSTADVLRQAIRGFREQTGMIRTLKWRKVSHNKIREYRKFIDIFIELKDAQFNAIALDHKQIDYEKYFGGDKFKAYYRFYFYLLSRNIDYQNFYYVYVHRRETPILNSLELLKRDINKHCDIHSHSMFRTPSLPVYPLKALEARDHKITDELQLADIILGAVGYHWNNRHLAAPGTAKSELAAYIARGLGYENLKVETPVGEKRTAKLNVWRFPLKPE